MYRKHCCLSRSGIAFGEEVLEGLGDPLLLPLLRMPVPGAVLLVRPYLHGRQFHPEGRGPAGRGPARSGPCGAGYEPQRCRSGRRGETVDAFLLRVNFEDLCIGLFVHIPNLVAVVCVRFPPRGGVLPQMHSWVCVDHVDITGVGDPAHHRRRTSISLSIHVARNRCKGKEEGELQPRMSESHILLVDPLAGKDLYKHSTALFKSSLRPQIAEGRTIYARAADSCHFR